VEITTIDGSELVAIGNRNIRFANIRLAKEYIDRNLDPDRNLKPIYTKKFIESDDVKVATHFSSSTESLVSQALRETMSMIKELKLSKAEYFKALSWAANQQKILWQKQLDADRKEGWLQA
jgi:hypothetical protein